MLQDKIIRCRVQTPETHALGFAEGGVIAVDPVAEGLSVDGPGEGDGFAGDLTTKIVKIWEEVFRKFA